MRIRFTLLILLCAAAPASFGVYPITGPGCTPNAWSGQPNYVHMCANRWINIDSACVIDNGQNNPYCWSGYYACMANWEKWCDAGIEKPPLDENGGSPIMINLAPPSDQRDFGLTCAAGGVRFDVNIDGVAEQTAWPRANSTAAFLVHPNADGSVTSGANLFGNQERWENGYEKLAAVFDENHDGSISALDARVRELQWWTDGQGGLRDGVAQPGELWPFLAVTRELFLKNRVSGFTDGCNDYRWIGRARLADTPTVMGGRYPGEGKPVMTSDVILSSTP